MTDDTSFNLIDEPWILARFTSGETREISLKETILSWTKIRELVGELPTVSFAIQRFLLAILYRTAATQRDAITDLNEWASLWDNPDGFSDDILVYLEEWHDRFDLWHRNFPFFQVADLRSAKNEISSLERLVVDSPLEDSSPHAQQPDSHESAGEKPHAGLFMPMHSTSLESRPVPLMIHGSRAAKVIPSALRGQGKSAALHSKAIISSSLSS